MATIATPGRRTRRLNRRWLVAAALLATLLVAGGAWWQLSTAAPTTALPPGWQEAAAAAGTIDATVNATGNVEPQAQADLRFSGSGTVSEVLVKTGQEVTAGQPLARIDTADLKLKLARAQADLAQAQADLDESRSGATPEEVAAAEADIARAQGQYQETAGAVTEADVVAADATVEQAQAALAQLEAGPKTTEVSSKQAALDRVRAQADEQQVTLQRTRDDASKAKTDTERKLQEASVGVQKAQSDYSKAYWNYQNVQNKGRQPAENEGQTNPELSDYGNLSAYEAFKQAELDLQNAQLKVDQAQQDLEAAQQDELTAIAQGERQLASSQAQVREAEAALDELLAGADADKLAQARANLADAQAKRDQLLGAKRSGSLAAAEAQITSAQASLDKLLADPKASAIARNQAAVARADADVALAQREIDQATLLAPFAGTVAAIGIELGEPATSSGSDSTTSTGAAVSIADLRTLHVDVPVDELDIASIQEGQQVALTLDALPSRELTGTVERVAPLAEKADQGTRTYKVTVTIADAAGVRPGMTAVVQIVTEQRQNTVLVPRRAIVLDGGKSYVLKPTGGKAAPDGTPASERVPVQVGLSNNESVEIVSGLKVGDKVLLKDVVETFNPIVN